MIVLAIVFAAILLIALLRFGVGVVYGEGGLRVTARIGFLSLRVYPRKVKPQKLRKKRRPKAERKKREIKKKAGKEKELLEDEPGPAETFAALLSAAGKVLGRVRRRLLIKRLYLHYVSASGDPMKTALAYGRLSAVYSGLMPAIESGFRIRRRELTASADFESEKPRVYVNAAVSLAVWESLYIFFAVLPMIAVIKRQQGKAKAGKKADRKEVHIDGEAPDQ